MTERFLDFGVRAFWPFGQALKITAMVWLLSAPTVGWAQNPAPADAPPSMQVMPAMNDEVRKTFEKASVLHDLSLAYLEKGDLENVTAAARRLIELSFPAEHEGLLAASLSMIADKLGEHQQFNLAQTLLDEVLETFERSASRARVLKMKARLYRTAGNNDQAIETWLRALELEEPDSLRQR